MKGWLVSDPLPGWREEVLGGGGERQRLALDWDGGRALMLGVIIR